MPSMPSRRGGDGLLRIHLSAASSLGLSIENRARSREPTIHLFRRLFWAASLRGARLLPVLWVFIDSWMIKCLWFVFRKLRRLCCKWSRARCFCLFLLFFRSGTERNGTERNGTERNGTERNERNGTERNGTERNGTERSGTERSERNETRFVPFLRDK